MSRKLWLACALVLYGCGRIGFVVEAADASEDSRVGDADGAIDARADALDSRVPGDTAPDVPEDTGTPGPLPLTETGIDLGGLVAHWTFDVLSASDGTTFPADNDAALVATLETGDGDTEVLAPGKIGNAIDFDGVDDRLVVPDSPALDIDGPVSLTAWINMDRLPVGDDDFGIVEKGSAYSLEVETDTVCVDFALYRDIGGFDELAPTSCALPIAEWHHLAAVFDGTDLIVYQNGVEVDRMAFTGGSVALTDAPVYIGFNSFRITRYMDGRIDEVTIWSRALSAAEVETLERLQRPSG
jgi:hypothetical protein